jgi:uncharacterized protein (TIGR03437 family)
MTLQSFTYRSFLALLFISVSIVSCSEDDASEQLAPTITSYSPESQFSDQAIMITGTNFGTKVEDVKVYFYDGAEAVVNSVTKTTINVTVPANAYVGPITVHVKEKEVEGESFTVLQMCYMGNEIFLPCNKTKPLVVEGSK